MLSIFQFRVRIKDTFRYYVDYSRNYFSRVRGVATITKQEVSESITENANGVSQSAEAIGEISTHIREINEIAGQNLAISEDINDEMHKFKC